MLLREPREFLLEQYPAMVLWLRRDGVRRISRSGATHGEGAVSGLPAIYGNRRAASTGDRSEARFFVEKMTGTKREAKPCGIDLRPVPGLRARSDVFPTACAVSLLPSGLRAWRQTDPTSSLTARFGSMAKSLPYTQRRAASGDCE